MKILVSFKAIPGLIKQILLKPVMVRVFLNGIRYDLVMRWRDRRFQHLVETVGAFTLGAMVSIERRPCGVRLMAEGGSLDITFMTPTLIRVRAASDLSATPPRSYAIVERERSPVPITIEETPSQVRVASAELACLVDKQRCRLTFQTPDGVGISRDTEGFGSRGKGICWARHLPDDEACHGLGTRAFAFNLRGRQLALWNMDPHPYGRGADPLYMSIPFYLGVRPNGVFGVLWDNPSRGSVDLGAAKPDEMVFSSEQDGGATFYFFGGPDALSVLREYADLTGKMPLPPLWTLGFHQSRQGYRNEKVFRQLAHEFRSRRLPCDVLYFDNDYMDNYRTFTWSKRRFPNLPRLVADLQREGFKTVALINPAITVDQDNLVCADGMIRNVFLKYPDGSPAIGPVWPGRCYFPDFTCSHVREWWIGHLLSMLDVGFDGLWNDMNEPALLSTKQRGTLPDYVQHICDGQDASHVRGGHNLYGSLMTQATWDALRTYRPDRRPFVITRAGYAGVQRFASSWTGDNGSDWDHLRLSISMVLNATLSGISFTGADIGGFSGNPDDELFIRWMQLGSMLPYFRVHSIFFAPRHEPWQFGERNEQLLRRILEQRYQLLPYFYSAFARCAQDGTPIIRPMWMVEPDNPALIGRDDQFLVGESLLVAPVLEPGQQLRPVYLPPGLWYDWETGQRVQGGQTIRVPVPLDCLPIYVRAGHTIPLWPVMQYVGEKRIDELLLRLFVGEGRSSLYEDAGDGLDYQQDIYRLSDFACTQPELDHLALTWTSQGAYTPPYKRVSVEVAGLDFMPSHVLVDGVPMSEFQARDGRLTLSCQPFSNLHFG